MTRFDIPKAHANFITLAMKADLVDAADLMVLTATHGADWSAMRDEVMEWAHARRHDREWRETWHANLCRANDMAFVVA